MPHRFDIDGHPAEDVVLFCSDGNLENGTRTKLTEAGVKFGKDTLRTPSGCGCFTSHELFPHLQEVQFNAICFHLEHHQLVGRVILMSHQACGAYASMGFRFDRRSFTDEERAFHHEELRVATAKLRELLDSQGFERIIIKAGVQWVDEEDTLHIDWIN